MFRPKSSFLFISCAFNRCVLLQLGDEVFHIYNVKGEEIGKFGKLFQEQRQNFLTLSGPIAIDRTGNVYLAFQRAGLIASFDISGNLRFFVKTIDATPLPEMLNYGGAIGFAPGTKFVNLAMQLYNERILILSAVREKGATPLDIYNSKTGEYMGSIYIPGSFHSFAVHKGKIYAMNDTSIIIYSAKLDF